MQLYVFDYPPLPAEMDFEGFFDMLQVKYPHIIGRKRLCCYAEEITNDLIEDCKVFNVTIRRE